MTGAARNALIAEFLPLARSLARWAKKLGGDTDNLEGEAFLGLVEAAEAYDPTRGGFKSYATNRIRARIQRAVEKAPIFRMTIELEGAARRARAAQAALLAAGIQRPSDAQIAEQAGLDVEVCREVLGCVPLPLDPDRFGVMDPQCAV